MADVFNNISVVKIPRQRKTFQLNTVYNFPEFNCQGVIFKEVKAKFRNGQTFSYYLSYYNNGYEGVEINTGGDILTYIGKQSNSIILNDKIKNECLSVLEKLNSILLEKNGTFELTSQDAGMDEFVWLLNNHIKSIKSLRTKKTKYPSVVPTPVTSPDASPGPTPAASVNQASPMNIGEGDASSSVDRIFGFKNTSNEYVLAIAKLIIARLDSIHDFTSVVRTGFEKEMDDYSAKLYQSQLINVILNAFDQDKHYSLLFLLNALEQITSKNNITFKSPIGSRETNLKEQLHNLLLNSGIQTFQTNYDWYTTYDSIITQQHISYVPSKIDSSMKKVEITPSNATTKNKSSLTFERKAAFLLHLLIDAYCNDFTITNFDTFPETQLSCKVNQHTFTSDNMYLADTGDNDKYAWGNALQTTKYCGLVTLWDASSQTCNANNIKQSMKLELENINNVQYFAKHLQLEFITYNDAQVMYSGKIAKNSVSEIANAIIHESDHKAILTLLDRKRSGDAFQAIKAANNNYVFITIDLLAYVTAKMLNCNAIYVNPKQVEVFKRHRTYQSQPISLDKLNVPVYEQHTQLSKTTVTYSFLLYFGIYPNQDIVNIELYNMYHLELPSLQETIDINRLRALYTQQIMKTIEVRSNIHRARLDCENEMKVCCYCGKDTKEESFGESPKYIRCIRCNEKVHIACYDQKNSVKYHAYICNKCKPARQCADCCSICGLQARENTLVCDSKRCGFICHRRYHKACLEGLVTVPEAKTMDNSLQAKFKNITINTDLSQLTEEWFCPICTNQTLMSNFLSRLWNIVTTASENNITLDNLETMCNAVYQLSKSNTPHAATIEKVKGIMTKFNTEHVKACFKAIICAKRDSIGNRFDILSNTFEGDYILERIKNYNNEDEKAALLEEASIVNRILYLAKECNVFNPEEFITADNLVGSTLIPIPLPPGKRLKRKAKEINPRITNSYKRSTLDTPHQLGGAIGEYMEYKEMLSTAMEYREQFQTQWRDSINRDITTFASLLLPYDVFKHSNCNLLEASSQYIESNDGLLHEPFYSLFNDIYENSQLFEYKFGNSEHLYSSIEYTLSEVEKYPKNDINKCIWNDFIASLYCSMRALLLDDVVPNFNEKMIEQYKVMNKYEYKETTIPNLDIPRPKSFCKPKEQYGSIEKWIEHEIGVRKNLDHNKPYIDYPYLFRNQSIESVFANTQYVNDTSFINFWFVNNNKQAMTALKTIFVTEEEESDDNTNINTGFDDGYLTDSSNESSDKDEYEEENKDEYEYIPDTIYEHKKTGGGSRITLEDYHRKYYPTYAKLYYDKKNKN